MPHCVAAGRDLIFLRWSAEADLSPSWVLIAWVLLLVGYGTKMGLAPMHTWKPDAYGEAPALVGAILAGGVTSVGFTAVLRVRSVVDAAGAGAIADRTLLAIGFSRCWWRHCSCSARATSNGCSPTRASSTWAS